MRLIRALILAAIAAVAATAFIGASSASATVLCAVSTSPCPAGQMYEPGAIIEGTATNATLTSNLATVVCDHSFAEAESKTTGGASETVTGTIKVLNFTGCETTTGVPCTVTVENIPYQAQVHWVSVDDGTLTVTNGGSGNPGAAVVCAGVMSCTFERSLFTLPVDGGNPAAVTANGVSLERTTFGGTPLCGIQSSWHATYTAVGGITSIFVLEK